METTTQTERKNQLHHGLVELFELAASVSALYEQTGGEVDWRTEQWQAWLEQSSGETVEALCQFVDEAEAVLAAAKREKSRIVDVIDRQNRRIDWAHDRLLDVLKAMDLKRVEHGTRLVYRKKNPGHVEQDGAVDLALMDPELVKEVPASLSPKLKEIGALLKNGTEVPGFKWVDGGEGVVIK